MSSEVLQHLEVGVAAVLEDACLYVVVSFLCVVVKVAQTVLGGIVIFNVFGQLGTTLLQLVAYAGGQNEADLTVLERFLAQDGGWHLLEADDERVVTGDIHVGTVQEAAEGQLQVLEFAVLLCGLMAGVGQVEDVLLLLRIEHQGVLVTLYHHVAQLLAYLLVHLAATLLTGLHLVILGGQLRA